MNLGTMAVVLTANTVGLDNASRSVYRLNRVMGNTSASMNRGMHSSMVTATRLGNALTASLALPLAVIAGASTQMFSEFEFSLAKVTGLVGIASDQTKEWGNAILNMAEGVSRGPQELAEALYFITSAGMRGADVMDILTLSAQSASAGLGETKDVADVLTSVMNAYGKANLSAAQANNILIATVREGKTEAPALVSAIGVVIPIASKLGVSFDQVGAAMAAMTRTGTKASTSATQLRQILNSLIKPSKGAETALHLMGTSSQELRDSLKNDGLMGMLQRITELTAKYGETFISKVFPNIRALNGVLDLMGENMEDNMLITERMSKTSLELDKALSAVSGTVKYKMNQAVASMGVSMVKLGEEFSKAVIPIIKGLADVIKGFTEWIIPLSGTIKTMIALGIATGPVILLLMGVVKAVIAIDAAITGLNLLVASSPLGLMFIAAAAAIAATYAAIVLLSNAFTKAETEAEKFLKVKKETDALINNKAEQAIVSEKNELEKLLRVAKSDYTTREQKEEAIKRINGISPTYLGYLDSEAIKTGQATSAISLYIDEIKRQSKAKAIAAMIDAETAKQLQIQMEGPQSTLSYWEKLGLAFSTLWSGDYDSVLQKETTARGLREMGESAKQSAEYIEYLTKQGDANRTTYESLAMTYAKLQSSSGTIGGGSKAKIQAYVSSLENAKKGVEDWLEVENNLVYQGKSTGDNMEHAINLLSVYSNLIKEVSKGIPKDDAPINTDILELFSKLNEDLVTTDRLYGVLGSTYDVIGKKADLYYKAIEDAAAFSPSELSMEDARVKNLVKMSGLYSVMAIAMEKQTEAHEKLSDSFDTQMEATVKQDGIMQSYSDTLMRAETIANTYSLSQMGFTNSMYDSVAAIRQMENELSALEKIKGFLTPEQLELFQRLKEIFGKWEESDKFTYRLEQISDKVIKLKADLTDMLDIPGFKGISDWFINLIDSIENATVKIILLQAAMDTFKLIGETISSVFVEVGVGLGNMIAGTSDAFGGLVDMLLDTLKKIGSILIKAGVIIALFAPTLGLGMVAGGIALTAISAFATAKRAQNNSSANMAEGGIIPSGYPNDSFSANLTSHEAVIPLDRLPQIMGLTRGEQQQRVEFIIDGRVLKGILADANMMGGIG